MSKGRHTLRAFTASIAGLFALGLAGSAAAGSPDCSKGNRVFSNGNVRRLTIVGLTSDARLVCFADGNADKAVDIGPVTGLVAPDAQLVGIDFRVQDGKLYGVGNGGGVYTLDPSSGAATLVSMLTVALDGTKFGVDFNPAADRLRIVSDTGQNLRHNVNAGGVTLEDGDLNYTVGVTALGIAGAAYTNNDLAPATGTTLFDVDTTLDQVALQVPPNNGTLTATGKLGLDVSDAGFDIFSVVVDDVTVDNLAFAVMPSAFGIGFYSIDLLTGAQTFIDPFTTPVVDIAIPLAR
jgi:hypothetical protein